MYSTVMITILHIPHYISYRKEINNCHVCPIMIILLFKGWKIKRCNCGTQNKLVYNQGQNHYKSMRTQWYLVMFTRLRRPVQLVVHVCSGVIKSYAWFYNKNKKQFMV